MFRNERFFSRTGQSNMWIFVINSVDKATNGHSYFKTKRRHFLNWSAKLCNFSPNSSAGVRLIICDWPDYNLHDWLDVKKIKYLPVINTDDTRLWPHTNDWTVHQDAIAFLLGQHRQGITSTWLFSSFEHDLHLAVLIVWTRPSLGCSLRLNTTFTWLFSSFEHDLHLAVLIVWTRPSLGCSHRLHTTFLTDLLRVILTRPWRGICAWSIICSCR